MTGATSYNIFHAMSGFMLMALLFIFISTSALFFYRSYVLFYRNVIMQIIARVSPFPTTRGLYKGKLASFRHIAMSFLAVALLSAGGYAYKEAASAAILAGAAIENRSQNIHMLELARSMSGGDFNGTQGLPRGITSASLNRGLVVRSEGEREFLNNDLRYMQQGSTRADQILQAPLVFLGNVSRMQVVN